MQMLAKLIGDMKCICICGGGFTKRRSKNDVDISKQAYNKYKSMGILQGNLVINIIV